MEAVENHETALQWLMPDRATLHGLVCNVSSCSLGERGESSGVQDPNAREHGKVPHVPALQSPPQVCLPSCAPHLGQSFSQTLKHRNFSLICSNAVSSWKSWKPSGLDFVNLFLQKMPSEKIKIGKSPKKSQRESERVARVQG